MKTQAILLNQSFKINEIHSPIVTKRFELKLLKFKVLSGLFWLMLKRTGHLFKAIKLIGQIKEKYQSVFGEPLITKAAKVDNRYFWRLATPGFPSMAASKMHENEMNRFLPNKGNFGMRSVLFAITKKCTLKCEHCFEWENLNKKETLSTSDIINIVQKYQDFGTTQMMFSGGEPLQRINDIYKILNSARPGTDFWIITSGIGLSFEKATKLKAGGLTGIMVSIDHYDGLKHDRFRGLPGIFDMACQAILNSNKAGLVSAISVCTTKNMVNEDNLIAFMDMAKNLGVSFVQFIEPRAVGHYKGKDVELDDEQINLLEKTYLKYNGSKAFQDYPIINYLGFHQRKVGCFGGGDRFFYIDTDGDAHICPYCISKVASTLTNSARDIVTQLSKNKCHAFSLNNSVHNRNF
ncbi:MAG: radical SAM protein [Bacteroidales bacterium]